MRCLERWDLMLKGNQEMYEGSRGGLEFQAPANLVNLVLQTSFVMLGGPKVIRFENVLIRD